MRKKTGEPMVETGLRIPASLHAVLVAWAEDDGRSLNAQIVHLLKQSAKGAGKSTEEGS